MFANMVCLQPAGADAGANEEKLQEFVEAVECRVVLKHFAWTKGRLADSETVPAPSFASANELFIKKHVQANKRE